MGTAFKTLIVSGSSYIDNQLYLARGLLWGHSQAWLSRLCLSLGVTVPHLSVSPAPMYQQTHSRLSQQTTQTSGKRPCSAIRLQKQEKVVSVLPTYTNHMQTSIISWQRQQFSSCTYAPTCTQSLTRTVFSVFLTKMHKQPRLCLYHQITGVFLKCHDDSKWENVTR